MPELDTASHGEMPTPDMSASPTETTPTLSEREAQKIRIYAEEHPGGCCGGSARLEEEMTSLEQEMPSPPMNS
jgi:hypothetical protein